MLIPETGCDTAGMGLVGSADEEDGAIAGAEVELMSEGGSNGVSNSAGLRPTSHGERDGGILTVVSEVTGGAVKIGGVKGVWGEDVTAFSSDLRATGGPAIADGPCAKLNGFRLALAPRTSR